MNAANGHAKGLGCRKQTVAPRDLGTFSRCHGLCPGCAHGQSLVLKFRVQFRLAPLKPCVFTYNFVNSPGKRDKYVLALPLDQNRFRIIGR